MNKINCIGALAIGLSACVTEPKPPAIPSIKRETHLENVIGKKEPELYCYVNILPAESTDGKVQKFKAYLEIDGIPAENYLQQQLASGKTITHFRFLHVNDRPAIIAINGKLVDEYVKEEQK